MTPQPHISYPRTLSEVIASRPVCADLSIVIPTLGRDILETCLCYIADGSRWPAKLIVVDQGQSLAVEAMLARLGSAGLPTAYIPSTQRGRSAGINRGLEQVESRFVAITDDDCFVRDDWLERMAERLSREPTTIWTGRVEAAGSELAFSIVLTDSPRRYTRPQFRVHPFIGGNVGMAMELVRQIGGFDEHPCLASAEDSDYGYRALRLGVPIAYDPSLVLYHFHWRDESERAVRYGDYARSQGGFYGTHLRRGDTLVMLQAIHALARSPVRWMRGLATGNREMARNGRMSTLNLLPGIWAGLRRRHAPTVTGNLLRGTET